MVYFSENSVGEQTLETGPLSIRRKRTRRQTACQGESVRPNRR